MSTKEQAAEYYKKNKEEVLRKRREKYQKNKKEEREYGKKYYEKNRELLLKKHHEKVALIKKGWARMNNPPSENGLYEIRLPNGEKICILLFDGDWFSKIEGSTEYDFECITTLIVNKNHRATWWRKV